MWKIRLNDNFVKKLLNKTLPFTLLCRPQQDEIVMVDLGDHKNVYEGLI